MKILSIDFDYFQNVDKDTALTCYPDGVDLPSFITELTWASYYANPFTKDKIRKINIREEELDTLYSLLDIQDKNTPVMVSYSHKDIYDFVNKLTNYDYTTRLSVTNIDMHHDMFNDNEDVDCGNWATHFMNNYPKYRHQWIANPISKEVYGITEKKEFNELVATSLEYIKAEKYNAIFLCRSDNWLPPHLDTKFNELFSQIKLTFHNIQVHQSILEPRTEYLKFAEQEKQYYTKYHNQKHKVNGENTRI